MSLQIGSATSIPSDIGRRGAPRSRGLQHSLVQERVPQTHRGPHWCAAGLGWKSPEPVGFLTSGGGVRPLVTGRGRYLFKWGFKLGRSPGGWGERSGLRRTAVVVPMAKIKIENVVASTPLGGELDLQAIALALGGAEYEPEQVPGLIYRFDGTETAALLFRSGKVVCTGAKRLRHVKTAIDMGPQQIEAAGLPLKEKPGIPGQHNIA